MQNKHTVIISNGHGQFHLINAAAAAHENQMLEKIIIGSYPTKKFKYLINSFPVFSKIEGINRFVMREIKEIPEEKITRCNISELFYQLANLKQNPFSKVINFEALSFRFYQREVLKKIDFANIKIYHCRSGYGGKTITEAKKNNCKVIVDHSIVHPSALIQMINKGGSYSVEEIQKIPDEWEMVLHDLSEADYILVNSDIVKKTLIDYGFDKSKIFVIYWGVDSYFENYLSNFPAKEYVIKDKIKFLFAGSITKRKGADSLLDVFQKEFSQKCQLTLAGGIDSTLIPMINAIKSDNIKLTGAVTRNELARLMLENDVLIFPTLAEGSARVVFEAMAAGMAIITTQNAGSVVESMKHGILIEPGDEHELRKAVNFFIDNPQKIKEFGENSRNTVTQQYNSSVYKRRILQLYNSILG